MKNAKFFLLSFILLLTGLSCSDNGPTSGHGSLVPSSETQMIRSNFFNYFEALEGDTIYFFDIEDEDGLSSNYEISFDCNGAEVAKKVSIDKTFQIVPNPVGFEILIEEDEDGCWESIIWWEPKIWGLGFTWDVEYRGCEIPIRTIFSENETSFRLEVDRFSTTPLRTLVFKK